MDINDLFDRIMKSINQFADEIAEQRLQEKMQDTGRGPENEGKRSGVWQVSRNGSDRGGSADTLKAT